MPLAKKVTSFTFIGLGTASSIAWVYWGLNENSHADNATDYRLYHGTAAATCGVGNAGCPSYVSEHLAAEKASTWQTRYLVGWVALDAVGFATLFLWPNRDTSVSVGAGSLSLKGTF